MTSQDLSSDQRPQLNSTREDDDGVIVPGSPPPIGSERTDVNPGDEAGVDELPDNEGQIPRDTDEDAVPNDEVPDIDVDNAERDDAPNPR